MTERDFWLTGFSAYVCVILSEIAEAVGVPKIRITILISVVTVIIIIHALAAQA